MEIIDDIKRRFNEGSVVIRLIYINIAVFLVQFLFKLFSLGGLEYWFMMPADVFAFLGRPWTIISFQFMHADAMHILFNMLWLFWFGQMFLQYFRTKQLLNVYLLGGFSGALFFMLAYNLVPALRYQGAWLLGASAGITAIAAAVATFRPNIEINLLIIGRVKLKYLVLVMIVLDFINIENGQNVGGHYSHIGGAIFGFFFGSEMLKGHDITAWFGKMMDTVVSLFPKRRKGPYLRKPINDRDRDLIFNGKQRANQAEIDRILDKISRSGYESLSKDEKDKLFRAGK